jgi:glycopeptide antibiotics resistance protein
VLGAGGLALLVTVTMFAPPASLGRMHAPVEGLLPVRVVEMILNVALFVPLGAAVGWIARARWLWALVALSVAIELLQLGLPDRQTELIDVVTNSVGACLGFLAAKHARRRFDAPDAEEGSR